MQDTTTNSALDVAEYILARNGPTESMKLQKLVYYCQAWSLVWKERPAFKEEIEAWVHGPVVSELYQMHAGQREVMAVGGHTERLHDRDQQVIDEVLWYYGHYDSKALRDLTHEEQPWQEARAGMPENLPSTAPVTAESMRAFYGRMPCGGGKPVADLGSVSVERAKKGREEIEGGHWMSLDRLFHELESPS